MRKLLISEKDRNESKKFMNDIQKLANKIEFLDAAENSSALVQLAVEIGTMQEKLYGRLYCRISESDRIDFYTKLEELKCRLQGKLLSCIRK